MTLDLALVPAGIVVGTLSALFGVGGGLLMVPLLVLALDQSQHLAEGTSLLAIVPTAIAGVLSHLKNRYVSLRHAGLLATGGIAGAYVGATLALEIDADTLRTVFGVFVAIMGVRLVVTGARARR